MNQNASMQNSNQSQTQPNAVNSNSTSANSFKNFQNIIVILSLILVVTAFFSNNKFLSLAISAIAVIGSVIGFRKNSTKIFKYSALIIMIISGLYLILNLLAFIFFMTSFD